jgi:hypothetical protein
MGEDSPLDTHQNIKNTQEVSPLEKMDLNFKSGEEDSLINLRSNRLRNSKTYGVKPKLDKKYTSTKSTINTALSGS